MLSRFDLATKYNLTSCPIQTPYVDNLENKCYQCEDNGYFNLGDRRCTSCTNPKEYFNKDTGQCEMCP